MACVGDGLFLDSSGLIHVALGCGLEFSGVPVPNGGRPISIKPGDGLYCDPLDGSLKAHEHDFWRSVTGDKADGVNDETECIVHSGPLGVGRNSGGTGAATHWESLTSLNTLTGNVFVVCTQIPTNTLIATNIVIRGGGGTIPETFDLLVSFSASNGYEQPRFTSRGSHTPTQVLLGVTGGAYCIEVTMPGPMNWAGLVVSADIEDDNLVSNAWFCGWTMSLGNMGGSLIAAAASRPLTHIAGSLPPLGAWTRPCADSNAPAVFQSSGGGVLRADIARVGGRLYSGYAIVVGPVNSVPWNGGWAVQTSYTVTNPSPCSPAVVHTVADCYALTTETSTTNRIFFIDDGSNSSGGVCYENYGGSHGVRCSNSHTTYLGPGASATITCQQGLWEGVPFTAQFVQVAMTSILVSYEI